jgi:hypothetical protein
MNTPVQVDVFGEAAGGFGVDRSAGFDVLARRVEADGYVQPALTPG